MAGAIKEHNTATIEITTNNSIRVNPALVNGRSRARDVIIVLLHNNEFGLSVGKRSVYDRRFSECIRTNNNPAESVDYPTIGQWPCKFAAAKRLTA